ncbi:hypothetical protein [Chryseobacterium sp. NKUCC03_KSP]|uniref:hypothetical protein n=1 Tax=Chryseobacterium sp. NKUCC03_KSP TaxID=2842125 RepID=UPI001C5BCAEC|nr:hypothetical protein [Chryseobacterium sp. NKUCC03_KSP]MBW3523077.1 hypothetical protein [Chryseobacterium sp. NKUCC03_KSP]
MRGFCLSATKLQTSQSVGSDMNVLKDPMMLKRLNELDKMDNEDKIHILKVIDGFIKSIKLKDIAAF